MLHLVESAHRPQSRKSGWMMGSTLVHGALIATVATAGTREIVDRIPEPVDRIIYTAPSAEPRKAASATTPSGIPVSGPVIVLPRIPLPGFTIVGAVPQRSAPPVDWGSHSIDLTRMTRTPISGLPGIFEANTVDRVVSPHPGNSAPDYPPTLRGAGVTGDVVVQFIVDSTGRVERESIRVPHASHELFAEAARRWLPGTRYAPAEVAGRRVRQLVDQRIEFALTNR